MATITASPPAMSPPLSDATSPPSLPPLITTTSTPRSANSQRPTSYVGRRMSSYSSTSKTSQQHNSRPASHVFPAFHSSLPYTLVRDFAYPATHPLHYGPQPDQSGRSTPVSEARRSSDPAVASWDESRSHWSATPSWMADSGSFNSRDQLPAMAFNDGGPPYSEDEDLQSPIVTTSRHKKHKSSAGHERGRSPGGAGHDRGIYMGDSGFDPGNEDGPGGAVVNYPPGYPHEPQHRDSNFAKPIQRNMAAYERNDMASEDDFSEAEDETRFSKDYSFTIASPDEEMHGKAVALFDFESEHQNELPLKEGQIILVSYRHGQGWLVAEDPRTGESGLVPEEFVRLVRDIEGGLNGLNSVTLEDGHSHNNNGDNTAVLSPISNSNDPASAQTPTPHQQEFSQQHTSKPSNGSNSGVGDKHPPVQSTFSTSSRDFSPYPLPGKSDETNTNANSTTPVLLASVQEAKDHHTNRNTNS